MLYYIIVLHIFDRNSVHEQNRMCIAYSNENYANKLWAVFERSENT